MLLYFELSLLYQLMKFLLFFFSKMRTTSTRSCRNCGKCCDCYKNLTSYGNVIETSFGGQCTSRITWRQCSTCGTDISDKPANHKLCFSCNKNKGRGSVHDVFFTANPDNPYKRQEKRRCRQCCCDISDRPENHVQCLRCWRKFK